jgi:uncharacterized protein YdcH (DUF465 family)
MKLDRLGNGQRRSLIQITEKPLMPGYSCHQPRRTRMTHIPQDLHNAFPGDAEILRQLKATDAHFQHLAARFEALDSEADRIDEGLEPASDDRLERIKKQRLALLDEIAPIVAAARQA